MAGPAITNTLIMPLLIPPRVAALVGQHREAAALGTITAVQTFLQALGPLVGAASDQLSGWPCGRRRPFVLIGQAYILAGIYLMTAAEGYVRLLLAYQLCKNTHKNSLVASFHVCVDRCELSY